MRQLKNNKHLIQREGTSRSQRLSHALNPENIKLHDLNTGDWLEFAHQYARKVNYFTSDNPDMPNGDWEDFFEDKDELKKYLEGYTDGDAEPYMGLFISFLQLLKFPQKSLNELPKRHLDYHFREVLKLKEKPYQPDKVHVLVELAKNAKNTLIDEGTELNAGKDNNGIPLRYKTRFPLVANHTKISAIKSVFIDQEGMLRIAENARHPNGLDEEAEEGEPWSAFGNNEWAGVENSFYVASNVLKLKEGERIMTLEMKLTEKLKEDIDFQIDAFCTGKKAWVKCKNKEILAKAGTEELLFTLTLNTGDDEITAYDDEVHESGLKTGSPVLKVNFGNSYSEIKNLKLKKVSVKVDVKGVQSLKLQNEHGVVDPSKPFLPFGSMPKEGSKFKVNCEELNGKLVSKISLSWKWLGLPENFYDHYAGYPIPTFPIPPKKHSQIQMETVSDVKQQNSEKNSRLTRNVPQGKSKAVPAAKEVYVANNPALEKVADKLFDPLKYHFVVNISSAYLNNPPKPKLFGMGEERTIHIEPSRTAKKSEIEWELKTTFYHDVYPKLYAEKAIIASRWGNRTIPKLPNAPYTPKLDEFKLNYTAKAEIDLTSTNYDNEDAQLHLFHRHPFGIEKILKKLPSLLPVYHDKYLFIGLEKLETGSNLSLLFQVDEGSENSENSFFDEGEEPKWDILTKNGWDELRGRDILRNSTNNFQRSGIVELDIPKEASNKNDLFGDEFYWLRISLEKPVDAVPYFFNIHTQAVEAIFDNNENTTHLSKALPPDSIGQLVNRRSAVKAIVQPYSSFGGQRNESTTSFYQRVSERLRHKNRAVSIWDYEHLILEKFPEINKVKCLNHTRLENGKLYELSPGHITIVLVPRLPEDERKLRLKPKAGQDLMDRISEFLKGKVSQHTQVQIANPVFEEVRFEFKVGFKSGLDKSFYKIQTAEDLKKLLSPWTFDPSSEIRFSGSFYRYEIIHFLENLEYIDYIENFEMFHQIPGEKETKVNTIAPSNAMAVLVPAENHTIENVETC